ncbi:Thiol protease SEN102 [Apostasia shenzhenica]|uniref:Thiol protease SEN102 n=1 Tax=Apostasia shenzhenica TaxID=1088818 RepID=A0A2I0A464_9ASPA|nr:Thiol protease SEN102 [Apostasia shenzhenica]
MVGVGLKRHGRCRQQLMRTARTRLEDSKIFLPCCVTSVLDQTSLSPPTPLPPVILLGMSCRLHCIDTAGVAVVLKNSLLNAAGEALDLAAWRNVIYVLVEVSIVLFTLHVKRLLLVATKMSDGELTHDTEISSQDKSDSKPKGCMQMSGQDLESEENLWDLYHRWQKFYMISRDHEDMVKRFNRFKEIAKFVYEFNMSNYDPHDSTSCRMGLNMLSDMTDEERSCLRGYGGSAEFRSKLEEMMRGGSDAESPF